MEKEDWIFIITLIVGIIMILAAVLAGEMGKQARWSDNLLVVKTKDSLFVLDENMKCVSKRGR